MDKTAAAKIKMYAHLCAEAGWGFQPFVMDTYGAIRADARNLIHELVKKIRHLTSEEEATKFATKAWSLLTAAGISRAAIQLTATSRILHCATSSNTIVSTPTPTADTSAGMDMGTDSSLQPSPPAVAVVVTEEQEHPNNAYDDDIIEPA